MTYPAIGTVLLPKRGRRHLPALTVRQLHRADRAVTVRNPQMEKTQTVKLRELQRDYRMPEGVVR